MRAKRLMLSGGLALLLVTTSGLSQYGPPGGSSKGKSKGGGPGTSTSFPGGWTPNTDGRVLPGDPSGGSRSSFGGSRDPNQPFDTLARGGGLSARSELDPRGPGTFGRSTSPMGTANGSTSRESFRPPSSSGAFPSSRPGSSGGSDGRRGLPGGGMDSAPDSSFRRYDRDGDGVLSFEELPESLQVERATWDRDGNVFIDRNEFAEYFRARMDWLRQDEGGAFGGSWGNLPRSAPPVEEERRPMVYRAGQLPPGLPAWFTQLDSDRDAQVGLYEWKTSSRSLQEFTRLDLNNDGLITVAEVLQLTARPQTAEGDNTGAFVATSRLSPGSSSAGGSSRFGSAGGSGPGSRPGPGSGPPGGSGRPPPPSSSGRPPMSRGR